jgi:hypothetical protein
LFKASNGRQDSVLETPSDQKGDLITVIFSLVNHWGVKITKGQLKIGKGKGERGGTVIFTLHLFFFSELRNKESEKYVF